MLDEEQKLEIKKGKKMEKEEEKKDFLPDTSDKFEIL